MPAKMMIATSVVAIAARPQRGDLFCAVRVIARPLTHIAMTSALASPRAVAPITYRARLADVSEVALGGQSAIPATQR